jgi:predicted O-methyltransferase YrrM
MKGHTSYISKITPNFRLTMQQKPEVSGAFEKLLKEIKPKQIVEIGTAGGGTTLSIRETLDEIGLEKTDIKSFEVKEHKWFTEMRKRNIEIIVENIFSHSYKEIEKPEMVESFIKREGTTLILCDGGSKINEFNLLSKYLKSGDIIMAHDYVDTNENFLKNYKNKIWNWREIGDEHIKNTCEKYNLKSYMKETFDKVVWVCKIKE